MNSLFSDLHIRHTQLLQQLRAVRDRKQFVADAQSLLRDLRLAGRSVSPDQRERLESYAGYWGAFMSENTGEYLDTTLESEAVASTHLAGDELTLVYESGRRQTLPFLAPDHPAEPLVSRDELRDRIKRQLFAGDLALYGPPGIGKTVLAVGLAHDKEVLAELLDGVLWANLGRLSITGALNAWAAALGIPREKIAAMSSLEERQRALREKIGLRRMLLVVDDIREEESALELKLGGPNCAHLCTTRSINAAVAFAPEGFTVVNEMTTTESLALLSKLIPEAVESDPDTARELAAHTDGVPLTLVLIGRYLRSTLGKGQLTNNLQSLVARWQQEEAQVTSLPLLQDNASLKAATPPSLVLAVRILEEALDEESRRMFRALSVFAPKPNSFSRDAALTVSRAPAASLEKLLDFGLLEQADSSRYAVYQPIGDDARAKLVDEAAYERMVDFYVRYAEDHCEDHGALDLEWLNVEAALETASKHDMRDLLLRGVNAIYHHLEIRGLYDVAQDLLRRAREAAEHLGDTSGQTTILLYQGRLAEKQGDYSRAWECLKRGLALARQAEDGKKIADLLVASGIVEISRSELAKARKHLQEALEIYRERGGDPKCIGEIYSKLGLAARDQGEFESAKKYLRDGLALAHQTPDLKIELLLHLGFLEMARQNTDEAENYFHEGLELARQTENKDRIAQLLHAWGVVARVREKYDDAKAYLQEGLALAQEIGRRWYVGIILIEQGEVYLREQKPDTATAAFLRALQIAQQPAKKSDILFIVALALFGLGRVAEFRGNFVEAHRHGQASLAIMEAIGHVGAKGVKDWLAALSSRETRQEPHRGASIVREAEDSTKALPRPVSD